MSGLNGALCTLEKSIEMIKYNFLNTLIILKTSFSFTFSNVNFINVCSWNLLPIGCRFVEASLHQSIFHEFLSLLVLINFISFWFKYICFVVVITVDVICLIRVGPWSIFGSMGCSSLCGETCSLRTRASHKAKYTPREFNNHHSLV